MRKFLIFSICILGLLSSHLASSAAIHADTIPFEIGNDKRIYVNVIVNNKKERPCRFLIDTGATDIVLNASIPEVASLATFANKITNQGPTSSEKLPCTASTQSIKVGKTTLTNLKFLAISYPPHFWDGVIGLSFLKAFDVIFNYDRKEMYLYPKGKAPRPNTEHIKFTYENGIPVMPVTVTINGTRHLLRVEIDSGSDRVLDINTPYVIRHKLRGSKPVFAISTISGTGTTEGKLENVLFDEAKIGTTFFPLLPGAFSSLTTGMQSTTAFDGVIGNNLFMRFNQLWDFEHQLLYLSVNNNFYSPFYEFLLSK